MDDNLKYKIGIGLIPGVGDIMAKKLISYCGGVEAVFREKKEALMKIPGVGEVLAKSVVLQDILDKAAKEIDFITKHNIGYSYYLDDDYPYRLRQCPDSPVIFFYKGNIHANHPKIVSIVGTRKATPYGKDLCNRLVDELNQRKHCPVVVSGLAYGIDICGHRAALHNKLPTIAVLAHGLSQMYPAAHAGTAREIVNEGGALLTEFLSDSPIDKQNFVRRNRLIAGLADLTIVVESNVKGGALITADIANSYDRDVFAFPGRLTDEYSSGCNKLIKTNRANLLQSVEDIEYLMNWNKEDSKAEVPVQLDIFPDLSPKEESILKYLREHGATTIDDLSFALKLPMSELSTSLLNMELMGSLRSLPGKVYRAG
ncbi:MAG: DNA-processing protein DprA [Bacteroidales bacterium]|jgi:DNA processing protein|nr:DNA-processing protein DprA [Bacteroidales bacterium]